MPRQVPLQARVDEDLFAKLKESASRNLRSVSAETCIRLRASFAAETAAEAPGDDRAGLN
jgi:hypothetical protein